MGFSQNMFRGTVVPMVLSLLRDRPMYGYEMVKIINARTDGQLQWKEGTLYPILHRLEGARMLKAKWQDVTTDKNAPRKRKYYTITKKGLAELARRTEEWQKFSTAVNAILVEG